MKRLFLYTLCVLSACIVNAQTMNVHSKDGKVIRINSLMVKNTYFDLNAEGPQMVIVYNNDDTMRFDKKDFKYIDFSDCAEDIANERAALMSLYDNTKGRNWKINTNWGSDKPLGEWYGITTDKAGHVIAIDIWENGLDGYIPNEIGDLAHLENLELVGNPNLTGKIPESLGYIRSLRWIWLTNNGLTGQIPESFSNYSGYELTLFRNNLSGSIEILGKMKNLTSIGLNDNHFTGPIPNSLGDCVNLRSIDLSNNELSGELPESLGNLKELVSLMLYNNNITGTIPESFVNLSKLKFLHIQGNRMNGKISDAIINSEWWKNLPEKHFGQQEGYELTYNSYTSTDYSKDGKVNQLQKHQKGRGIPLVIIGNGFSDRLIADGTFDGYVADVIDAFFAPEPYTSLRDYFDIYSIYAVSENEELEKNTVFHANTKIQIPEEGWAKIKEYVLKIPELNGSTKDVTTLLIPSSDAVGEDAQNYATWDAERFSIAMTPIKIDRGDVVKKGISRLLVQHEGGGHAFGFLADEIVNSNASRTYSEEQCHNLDVAHENGYSLNIDWHNTPETVLWKDFMANPDYAIEGIGFYEGAEYVYAKGIYRPTEKSLMCSSSVHEYYNAPSRWAIYQRVMKLAGEDYSFETFLELDKKALEKIKLWKQE